MFTFDVQQDGEPDLFRVTATSRDVSHWERTGKGRSLAAIERDARMGQLEEIAHAACVRHGKFFGDLDTFRSTVDIKPIDLAAEAREAAAAFAALGDDLEEIVDVIEEEAGPTRPAH